MNNNKMNNNKSTVWIIAIWLISMSGLTRADITVLHEYTFGENDPGAVAGNPVDVTDGWTIDSAGSIDLQPPVGIPNYVDVTGAHVGTASSLAVDFTNTNSDQFQTVGSVSWNVPSDNWGVEAWVRPDSVHAGGIVGPDGNFNTTYINANSDGNYLVVASGVAVSAFTRAYTAGEWDHVALVRDGGTWTFYLNGSAVDTLTQAYTPGTASPVIGYSGLAYFDGSIDTVRYFIFDPGKFSTDDLDINYVIPEPSSLLLIFLGAMPVVALYRRRLFRG